MHSNTTSAGNASLSLTAMKASKEYLFVRSQQGDHFALILSSQSFKLDVSICCTVRASKQGQSDLLNARASVAIGLSLMSSNLTCLGIIETRS